MDFYQERFLDGNFGLVFSMIRQSELKKNSVLLYHRKLRKYIERLILTPILLYPVGTETSNGRPEEEVQSGRLWDVKSEVDPARPVSSLMDVHNGRLI